MNIIKSKLLSGYPEILHGISTRNDGVSPGLFGMNLSFGVGDSSDNVHKNRELFFDEVGTKQESVAFTKQVHGRDVQMVNKPGVYESRDALITNVRGLFLAISVADCMPILLYDLQHKAIAAVHSGWRGSALKILSNAVTIMQTEFRSDPNNLVAFLGPSAGACCYEVGEEVAAQFDERYVDRKEGRRPHLDLKQYNKNLLSEQLIPAQNIELSSYCTICNPDLFHSYRRDRDRSGRMLAVIGMI